MNFDEASLRFFPTPYPDEIFYSVLCRYHARSGDPSVYRTNRELWGKDTGKDLLLPSELERLAKKLPQQAKLTAERFITENTIYPFLKPFIPRERGEALFEAMKNGTTGHTNLYNLSGFSRLRFTRQLHLRCCAQCMQEDISVYGEAYWHRLHQLPGVYICPRHAAALLDTGYLLASLPREFYLAASSGLREKPSPYSGETVEKLTEFSRDALWLLQNGSSLGCHEETKEIYDAWLRAKGFRGWNGKTWHKKLCSTLIDFYGQDFLSILDAYDTGILPWPQRLLQQQSDLIYPMYHLILIRFLAGSAVAFFQAQCEKPLPFGPSPWPCRNKICEHHLKDVIERIDLKCVKGIYKATLSCPHCGMVYRRKGAMPKEKQYAGQIDVVDYGWRWKENLKAMLIQDIPVSVTASALYCDIYTVLKFGVDLGVLPPERLKRRNPYIPKGASQTGPSRDQTYYRQTWKAAVTANPGASRSELIQLDNKSYAWLRANDLEWFEQNSPAPKKSMADWSRRDDEYMELVSVAVSQIKGAPGKPIWINRSSVGRKAGIANLHSQIASGRLPQTAAYLEQALESMEQWRKRKILWAIQTLQEQGEMLTLNKVKMTATISPEASATLNDFIMECLEKL